MKRISMRLIVAAITFVVGVLAAWGWFLYRTPAPPVTVCQLIQNLDGHTSEDIRIRAVLFGHHELGLYAPDCQGRQSYIHAYFEREAGKKFGAMAKPIGIYHHVLGLSEPEYLVSVTVTGRLTRLPGVDPEVDCDEKGRHTGESPFSYDIYCYYFLISGVEQVEAADIAWPR